MNTTPSHRLGFLHHIRLVPLFACILGGILVLFALSSALAGYFLWQADRDQRDVTAEIEIRTGLANSSDFLRSARINMIQAGAASRIAEMEAMKRNIAQAESEIKQSQQGYRAYQNRPVKTPADEALDTELNQRFQAYITGMQPMLKYAKNGMFEAIINHESEQIRPLDNAYTDILNKAVKIRSTRANQLAELAHQRTRLGGMFMIGAFVLALVMTLITFMVIRRIVIRPLQHAAQRIEKIASGDLTMNDEPAGRNEIGRLNRHLQQMQHSLGMTVGTVRQGAEEIYRGTSEISAGNADLSSRTEEQAAKEIEGLISESVRLIDLGSDEVATAGKTMSTIVDAVASVTHIMQEIAAASDEQSRGITQVSQAISEMDKVTQQNASLVEEASAAAVSLEEQAARLTEAVDVFRLHKHSVSAEPRGAGEPVSFATV
ncbi:Tar ligand binding domain-containing protein [Escherichia coli]